MNDTYQPGVQAQYNPESQIPYEAALPDLMNWSEFQEVIGSFPKLPENLERMTDEQRRDALEMIDTFFLPMEYMYMIYSKLRAAIKSSYHSLSAVNEAKLINQLYQPEKKEISTQPTCFSVLGVPGIGKTSTIIRCLSLMPQVIHHTMYKGNSLYCSQILYLRVECPSDCSVKTLIFSIIEAINDAMGRTIVDVHQLRSINISSLSLQIKAMCITYHVGVLVIDEIQNAVSTAKQHNRSQMLINFLVSLTNKTNTSICFVGTPLAEDLFTQEAHLERRTRGLRLTPMKYDGAYRKFISELWRYQFTRGYAELTDALAKEIYNISCGVPAYITMVFREAQGLALMMGENHITTSLIKETTSILTLHPPKFTGDGTSISAFDFSHREKSSKKVRGELVSKSSLVSGTRDGGLEKTAEKDGQTKDENGNLLSDVGDEMLDIVVNLKNESSRGRKKEVRSADDIVQMYENGDVLSGLQSRHMVVMLS